MTTLKVITLMALFLILATIALAVLFWFLEVATRPDYGVTVRPYVQEVDR